VAGLRRPLLAAGVLAAWLVTAVAEAAPPNIVLIVADDLGWNDVGYHGSEIETPRLDALAAGGVVLQQFHVQPSCSPTRAALMTGKSPLRLGITRPLAKLQPAGLGLDESTLAERLRDAGYQTFLTGKWHLGFARPPFHPNARGFDHFYGHVTGGVGYWDHVHGGGLDWQRNGETLRESGYSTQLIADEAVRLLRNRDRSRPVFLFASFNAPHLPNEAPDDAIANYAHIDNPFRRVHAAMVSEFDAAVGRLVDTLEAEGMSGDTLIWFMSDNGGLNTHDGLGPLVGLSRRLQSWFGRPLPVRALEFIRVNSLEGGADNSPLRRGKGSVYEGGSRVPSLLYWPDHLQPRRIGEFVTVQDIVPTVLRVAGVETTDTFDGVDQWPLLRSGQAVPAPDYVTTGQDGEALYRWPWKLIAPAQGDAELYHLADDPVEALDQAEAEAVRVAHMLRALREQPRAEPIHVPLWRVILDPDFFGGEEDRPPWSEIVEAHP
jgi:arylsulfatase A-like enzyme